MSVSFILNSCRMVFWRYYEILHQRALRLQQPLPEMTLESEISSVEHSSDDSHFLLEFLFAQEICFGVGHDRGMVSARTTEWHLWVIKRSGRASKELTCQALTFTIVEIKAPLQKIYGNSNVQSATVFVRCLALTHPHTYTPSLTLMRGLCGQQMTSKC